MAAKTFVGSVSIILNTKGEIALKKDEAGKFTAADSAEIYKLLKEFGKSNKAGINKYSLFTVDGGKEPVLLVNRYGNPYIALLKSQGDAGTSKKSVTKLA